MVAYFNSKDCPDGWKEFSEGTDRVLIGKGNYIGNDIKGD
jgi:hypothetical protein